MKKFFSKTYAWILLIALLVLIGAGIFSLAFSDRENDAFFCVIGLAVSLVLTPVIHETGHIFFAKISKMRVVYTKFFCFRFENSEKFRFSICNPFLPDRTDEMPKTAEKVKKRFLLTTVGGLVFGGTLFLGTLVALFFVDGVWNRFLYGFTVFSGYSFLLNAMPCEYGEGKTDASVALGIIKGRKEENAVLLALQIHGKLSEGKSFSEMDEGLFVFPETDESEPTFWITGELSYRRYLEKGDTENAVNEINRLGGNAYLPQNVAETVAGELAYMNALNGDGERAVNALNLCPALAEENSARAKRILCAVASLKNKEIAKAFLADGYSALKNEKCKGLEKSEKILLDRLSELLR